MTAKKGIFKKKKLILKITAVAVLILLLIGFVSTYIYFSKRIFPGIYIANIYVGLQTPDEAENSLRSNISIPPDITLTYYSEMDAQVFKIPSGYIEVTSDYKKSVSDAFSIGRDEKPFVNLKAFFETLTYEQHLPVVLGFNSQKLTDYLQVISGQASTDAVYPSVKVNGSNIIVDRGKPGVEVDTTKIESDLIAKFSNLDFSPLEISTRLVNPTLSETEANELYKRAEKLLSKDLKLQHKDISINVSGTELVSFVAYKGGYDVSAIYKRLEAVAKEIETPPQNPVLVFAEGRAQEFTPAKYGIELRKEETADAVIKAIREIENSDIDEINVTLLVTETSPAISMGDINNLGLKELIGKGTSRYKGSIPSRVHNVALATSKINGVIVAPGEEFSFNKALGDISKFTGYKEAYIIQDGKTVLGDGGGVCQVSTTLFRAVLNAGLPITERRGHSYRVGYYEQDSGPGIDATVFSPTTDFKFKNDTANHILIQGVADSKNLSLVFEIYGTNDGRIASVTKPVITSSIPPADDLYVDDPTLPMGTIKQIEHKAWGAKVSFNYEVKRNGEIIYQKTFLTNYKPWQAVFLKGTKPL